MEPLDSDLYVVHQSNPKKRFNLLYIVPALGLLWLFFLLAAAIFQWPISGMVDSVMGAMLLALFVLVGLLFWAMAPKENR